MINSKFSLVLSGGGALGFAHMGIIEDLYENNLKPAEIIGTSMGGLIGSLLAIGLNYDEIEKKFRNLSGMQKWISFSFSSETLISLEKLEKMLLNTFGDMRISDTKIPLKLIATDFQTGEKVVFSRENDVKIIDGVLSTIAIPGLFPPRVINENIYIDGFCCENLGITQTSHDIILASDVVGQRSFKANHNPKTFKIQNLVDNFEKTMRIMISNQTQQNLQLLNDRNVFLCEINTRNFRTFQFKKYDKIKKTGKNEINEFLRFMKKDYNNDSSNLNP